MPATPPFYKQETDYSCAPACLRMVLASLGVHKTEQDLRVLCDCTALEGTDAFKLVQAARSLGFHGTRKDNLHMDELQSELERGLFPIAYVRTKTFETHAVVVIGMSGGEIGVLDPLSGEYTLSIDQFNDLWGPMRRLTILIE